MVDRDVLAIRVDFDGQNSEVVLETGGWRTILDLAASEIASHDRLLLVTGAKAIGPSRCAGRADSRHSLISNCPVQAKHGENKPFAGKEELLPLSNFSGQTTIFGGFRYDQATPQVKEGKPRSASCQCEDSQGKA